MMGFRENLDVFVPFKKVEMVSIGHSLESFMDFLLKGMLVDGA